MKKKNQTIEVLVVIAASLLLNLFAHAAEHPRNEFRSPLVLKADACFALLKLTQERIHVAGDQEDRTQIRSFCSTNQDATFSDDLNLTVNGSKVISMLRDAYVSTSSAKNKDAIFSVMEKVQDTVDAATSAGLVKDAEDPTGAYAAIEATQRGAAQ